MHKCKVKLKNNSVSGITILWHVLNEYVPGCNEPGGGNGVHIIIATDDTERLTKELSTYVKKVAPAVVITVEWDKEATKKGTFYFDLETKYRGR